MKRILASLLAVMLLVSTAAYVQENDRAKAELLSQEELLKLFENARKALVSDSAAPTATPSPTPEPPLQRGDEGEDVMALQKRLIELKYLAEGEDDGKFGPTTAKAVHIFKTINQIDDDCEHEPEWCSLERTDYFWLVLKTLDRYFMEYTEYIGTPLSSGTGSSSSGSSSSGGLGSSSSGGGSRCALCAGTGKCIGCGGDGLRLNLFSNRFENCTGCAGKRTCWDCGGDGWK